MDPNPIVVGYDGSLGARAALRWAVDESVRHAAPLRLVLAARAKGGAAATAPTATPAFTDPWRADVDRDPQSVLARGVDAAAACGAGVVPVSGVVVDGPAATVLYEQSTRARMLVLGSGRVTGLVAGSVGLTLAAAARCPVVVPHHDAGVEAPAGPVIVGVDDSAEAQLAIGFAFEEAAGRGVGLTAVHVWNPPSAPWRNDVSQDIVRTAERAAAERSVLRAALHGWNEKHPEVAVTADLLPGDTGPALTMLTRDAQLVVVGPHTHNGLRRRPGSVSRCLLHHARCPVALVRTASSPHDGCVS